MSDAFCCKHVSMSNAMDATEAMSYVHEIENVCQLAGFGPVFEAITTPRLPDAALRLCLLPLKYSPMSGKVIRCQT